MPDALLEAYEARRALNRSSPRLPSMSSAEFSALVQWSDLILFDYITGHYDR
jgi:hypothetical protein